MSLIFLSCISGQAMANNSFNSEACHAAGGAVMAGTLVWVSDKYWPEQDRAWVGFSLSTAAGVLSQYYEYNRGSNSAQEALIDAAAHTLGSALGAYVTDGYWLTPVIKPEAGGRYVGIDINFRF
ncbi:hypothetical protein LZP73_13820 [Shewanella sp. AS16]|uniref:hypothetical protein n=1 Tax=Shewanella sp. AS16 TaxID=2907625 RepID=UPI001F2F08D5|nr:hypothetical protein [Shewanella sp. AS16]MCE9687270.1 hypothetical protein [Shewanella sp. AS16]